MLVISGASRSNFTTAFGSVESVATWPARSLAVTEKRCNPDVPAAVVLLSIGTVKLYVLFAPAVPAMGEAPLMSSCTVAGSAPVPESVTVPVPRAARPGGGVGPGGGRSLAVAEKRCNPDVPAAGVLLSIGTVKLYVLFAPAVPAMGEAPLMSSCTVAGSTPVPESVTVAVTMADSPAVRVGP